jgi:Glycosyltransferases involved in cell wall biogenesis
LEAQIYRNFEVIIVDDGSPCPVTIDKEYPFQCKVIRQENKGLSSARNFGLKHAVGKYVKYLDADDTLTPLCLLFQVNSLLNTYKTISVIGHRQINEESLDEVTIYPFFQNSIDALLIDNLAPVHCYLFPIDMLINCNGMHEGNRVLGGCEDYDIVFRLALNDSHFITCHDIGAVYYRRGNTMSKQKDSFHRSRFNVWSYNVTNLLKKESAVYHIAAIITGLYNLLNVSSGYYSHLLTDVICEMESYLKSNEWNMDKFDARLLINRIDAYPCLNGLKDIINENVCLSSGFQPLVNRLCLVDYKLILQGTGVLFDDKWLINILNKAREYNNEFAIYGAGEVGRRIETICAAAGFKPKCFFDTLAVDGGVINDTPVLGVKNINNFEVKCIIIGSISFYDEIYSFLKSRSLGVDIL